MATAEAVGAAVGPPQRAVEAVLALLDREGTALKVSLEPLV
jgi:hypothetical protein